MENQQIKQILTKIEENERTKEKFEKAYAMLSVDLSIRHQKHRLCFTTLLLLPFFFNGVFERNGESVP